MAEGLEAYFENDDELRAYETFCAEQERAAAGFSLDEPALVCRWRMARKRVPLLNRHIRALAARRVQGAPLTHNMLSWVKQHVEWSLAEGSYAEHDGVLMLVIDVNGNAAMTVGAYEPLPDAASAALLARAEHARAEAGETSVAPELLGAVRAGRVLLAAEADEPLCAAADLLVQLAQTRGLDVRRVPAAELASAVTPGADSTAVSAACANAASAATAPAPACQDGSAVPAVGAVAPDADAIAACADTPALFLVSDEHGVVPATDGAPAEDDAAALERLAADCAKLFA